MSRRSFQTTVKAEAERRAVLVEQRLVEEAQNPPPVEQPEKTLGEIREAYLKHVEVYYNGSSHGSDIKHAVSYLDPWRDLPISQFGPLTLRKNRDGWIADRLSRVTINHRTGLVTLQHRRPGKG